MECAVDLFACEMEDETVRSHVRKRLWLAASPIDRSREKEAFLTTVLLDAQATSRRATGGHVSHDSGTPLHTHTHTPSRLGPLLTDAPPRFEVGRRTDSLSRGGARASERGRFNRREHLGLVHGNSKNLLALFMFLVIMSAALRSVVTKGTSISNDSTMSRTK